MPSTTPKVDDRAALVDEYGDLAKRAAESAPFERRLKELRAIIQSWFIDASPQTEFSVEGNRYMVTVSARECERKVDPVRLYKAVGLKRFLKVVSVTLEAMKVAGMEKLNILCVDTRQTGKRKLTPIEKGKLLSMEAPPKTRKEVAAAQLDQLREAA